MAMKVSMPSCSRSTGKTVFASSRMKLVVHSRVGPPEAEAIVGYDRPSCGDAQVLGEAAPEFDAAERVVEEDDRTLFP